MAKFFIVSILLHVFLLLESGANIGLKIKNTDQSLVGILVKNEMVTNVNADKMRKDGVGQEVGNIDKRIARDNGENQKTGVSHSKNEDVGIVELAILLNFKKALWFSIEGCCNSWFSLSLSNLGLNDEGGKAATVDENISTIYSGLVNSIVDIKREGYRLGSYEVRFVFD